MEMESLPNGPGAAASKLTESLKLEHQFLRVPFEHLKKSMRANHRIVDKEMNAVISGVADAVAPDRDMSKEEAVHHLTCLVSKLQGLKRKLEEGTRTEHLQAQKCRARLDHLDVAEIENHSEWNSMRLKRILVDYMLRLSYYDTAMKLAETSNMQDLVDIEVFLDAKKVIDALQNKEVAPALAWCAENKSRLRKSKVLFEPKQWDYLVEQFKHEFCRLYGMTLEPLLNIYLQAGLSALKTPLCYEDDCTKEDPLSQESFRKLALPLPFSKQHHSKLVCYITKELMDFDNPPLVLPNGYVYSTKALEEMAKKNDGKITCPRTGLVFNYTELVKAYIS
ncbi:protein MAEA homolog isoform X2 [Magnolia sinica]|uniref:protein MAEA homolog isoform X2 n=1 Tax=Magnolia sinica TaxID=86752 RepID=UPI0026588181|nr:protein MAEA homolog isoform X2 [Magnolia sinica]